MNWPTFDNHKAVIIAGFLGSVLSLSFVDHMSRKQRAVAVVSGVILAHYIAPLISHIFNEESYVETIGFLVGLFGMSITAAVFRAIKHSDLWGLIKRRFGGAEPSITVIPENQRGDV